MCSVEVKEVAGCRVRRNHVSNCFEKSRREHRTKWAASRPRRPWTLERPQKTLKRAYADAVRSQRLDELDGEEFDGHGVEEREHVQKLIQHRRLCLPTRRSILNSCRTLEDVEEFLEHRSLV